MVVLVPTLIAHEDVAIRQYGAPIGCGVGILIPAQISPDAALAASSTEFHLAQRSVSATALVGPPVAGKEQRLGLVGPDSCLVETVAIGCNIFCDDSKARTDLLKQAPECRIMSDERCGLAHAGGHARY